MKGMTKLEELRLHNPQVTDIGLDHLKDLASLKKLGLYNTQISDAGVMKIRQALPECEVRL